MRSHRVAIIKLPIFTRKKINQMSHRHSLYILVFQDYIKIGITNNIPHRLKQISKDWGEPILTESYVIRGIKGEIEKLESRLHSSFFKHNMGFTKGGTGKTEFFHRNQLENVLTATTNYIGADNPRFSGIKKGIKLPNKQPLHHSDRATRLTKQDVWDAAKQLLLTNDNPSILKIHSALGRGGYATIQKHLKSFLDSDEYKAILDEQIKCPIPAMPESVNQIVDSALAQIWKAAIESQASVQEDLIESSNQVFLEEIDFLKSELTKERERVTFLEGLISKAMSGNIETKQCNIRYKNER